jgi:Flp pilus assembly protein TadB
MRETGLFLISFGILSVLFEIVSRAIKSAKWQYLRAVSGGKRYLPDGLRTDGLSSYVQHVWSLLTKDQQAKLKRLLIWSGTDPHGRADRFLGSVLWIGMAGLTTMGAAVFAAVRFHSWAILAVGLLAASLLLGTPALAVLLSRSKRADQILRDTPLLIMTMKRELVRDANYLQAFQRAEKELQGVLQEEIKLLNEYVRSTQGDLRNGLEQLRIRCGHRAMDLFCMTILQGMDTDRVQDGLTELDIQMSGLLRDRIQKQTEKRNLMVFFGTLAAASILLLQGSFYGFMNFKEQISNLPFY